jgi:NhaC family Na+:H+ antiporter
MIACNQTLAIMLTHQLCNEMISDHEEMAINLENTVVVLAPLIPWSIAGGVPLAAVGAPQISLLFAFYLYLIPLWNFFKTTYKKRTN